MELLLFVILPTLIALILLYFVVQLGKTYNPDREVGLILALCFCGIAFFFVLLFPIEFPRVF
ncbi:MAG: hypothetical protein AAGG02_20970 [Cyanobacteria bacterium P01_H01_bin.15]